MSSFVSIYVVFYIVNDEVKIFITILNVYSVLVLLPCENLNALYKLVMKQ